MVEQDIPGGPNKDFLNEQDEESCRDSLEQAGSLLDKAEELVKKAVRDAVQIQQIEEAKKLGEESSRN